MKKWIFQVMIKGCTIGLPFIITTFILVEKYQIFTTILFLHK